MVPKVCIIDGKAAVSYTQVGHIIRLITGVQHVVNNDPNAGDLLRCLSHLITILHLQKLSSQLTMCRIHFYSRHEGVRYIKHEVSDEWWTHYWNYG